MTGDDEMFVLMDMPQRVELRRKGWLAAAERCMELLDAADRAGDQPAMQTWHLALSHALDLCEAIESEWNLDWRPLESEAT